MYYCSKCEKEITTCPACKQRISDTTAMLYYQLATICFAVAAVFFLLELELQEKTSKALQPFKAAAEIAEKKAKIEAVDIPKPPKKTTPASKAQAPKKSPIRGQTADFRAAMWGTSRSHITDTEKAQLLNDASAYDLDYLDTINNLNAVVRYTFSSNRLESGHYIFFGDKCSNLEQLDQASLKKIGDNTPNSIQSLFEIFPTQRNKALTDVKSIELFYHEMLTSLVAQLGEPIEMTLAEQENQFTPGQKAATVMAFNRALSYSWDTPKSIVDLVFAAHENSMYLSISYHNRKTAK
ncbi:MAG: hypothetical protein CVV42_17920 [Candidatus Riflebacteria bacterium HGW-Riflebacteria-2]|jgi:hypothetical protein|nr:MAG: hypothetical protein CVV42_17920 [Candidatus Riflebacteria bacterium HGW-Riflebacteria-2]